MPLNTIGINSLCHAFINIYVAINAGWGAPRGAYMLKYVPRCSSSGRMLAAEESPCEWLHHSPPPTLHHKRGPPVSGDLSARSRACSYLAFGSKLGRPSQP